MGRQVSLTRLAESDLEEIVSYIAQDNPRAALKVGRQIVEKLQQLADFPLSGRIVPEFEEENLREIVHSHYRIIYLVHPSQARIDIIRIWHGARGELEI